MEHTLEAAEKTPASASNARYGEVTHKLETVYPTVVELVRVQGRVPDVRDGELWRSKGCTVFNQHMPRYGALCPKVQTAHVGELAHSCMHSVMLATLVYETV